MRALEDEKIGASAFDDVEGLEDDEDPNAVWNWDMAEEGGYDAAEAVSEWLAVAVRGLFDADCWHSALL
jgi:hypothetical protein